MAIQPELDELRSVSTNAKQIIAAMESSERARSGIGNLRIRFNGVFGYFIEVSKANAVRVPADYERRQTSRTLNDSRHRNCERLKRKSSALKNESCNLRPSCLLSLSPDCG